MIVNRRTVLTLVAGSTITGFSGCTAIDNDNNSNDTDEDNSTENRNGDDSGNSDEEFDGWVNEDELEDGYTVIHISSNWELVDATDANDWDDETVEISRRGICKRYFVYEEIPEGYEIFYQGACEDGVTVTIEDDAGRMVNQLTLPEKNLNGETEDEQEPNPDSDELWNDTLSNHRDFNVELTEGQTISVTAEGINDGEMLLFQVGDGQSWVHSYQFYEEDDGHTEMYDAHNGIHQVYVHPQRDAPPMDKDVEMKVLIEVGEP